MKTLRQQVDEILDAEAYLRVTHPEVLEVTDRIMLAGRDGCIIMEPEDLALACKHPSMMLRKDGLFDYEGRTLIPNRPRWIRGAPCLFTYQMRKSSKPVLLIGV